ncbi:TrmH family RNA methyltransferase [Curtobacterium ammoniigenes]|uniref:TrmH family RNA methyltransferase n=1 Tax=Curtobacterium ammoniigenes TaxID=395387 RepID=UPI00082B1FA5|nr:RNA methyltransferase [Curtobacterium ammoniigenes]
METVRIDSLADPRLDDYARLTDVALRSATEPDRGLYIAESNTVIERALEAGHRPRSVLVQEKWLDRVLPLVAAFDGPVFVGDDLLLEALTGFRMHRGALAAMHRPALPDVGTVVRDARLVVVLEDIVDHTNVGAVFRSVAGLGADAVLVSPRCADPLYRRSVRVSMGTVLQVPWTRIGPWPLAAAELRAAGFRLAAMALSDASVPLDAFVADVPDRLALIMGTEGAGLSREAVATADTVVRIPMRHGVDSLNVAAASAVAMWAAVSAQQDARRRAGASA